MLREHSEHYWFSPSVAAERKKTARYTAVTPAPPDQTRDHTHAFGAVAFGHSDVVYHPEATGLYVAIDTVTGKPIVYTHHSPHTEHTPARSDARKVGVFDPAELTILCVPSGPTQFNFGTAGLANGEITPWHLEFARTSCETAGLPQPRVAGRPVKGPRWSDTAVLKTLETLDR